jgi:hypothetical protein
MDTSSRCSSETAPSDPLGSGAVVVLLIEFMSM